MFLINGGHCLMAHLTANPSYCTVLVYNVLQVLALFTRVQHKLTKVFFKISIKIALFGITFISLT